MKHIKYKKIFESKDDIEEVIETIKDICLELQDEGYRIEIIPNKKADGSMTQWGHRMYISLEPDKDEYLGREIEFNISDIMEVINRLIDYLTINIENFTRDCISVLSSKGGWIQLRRSDDNIVEVEGVRIFF